MMRLALKTLIRASYPSDFEENKGLLADYGLYLSTNIFITVLTILATPLVVVGGMIS